MPRPASRGTHSPKNRSNSRLRNRSNFLHPSSIFNKRFKTSLMRAAVSSQSLGITRRIAITPERIKQLNALVLRGLPNEAEVIPGDFRKHSVGVMGYRGAPWQDCEYLVGRLCDWLNGPDFRSDDSEMQFALILLNSVIAHLYIAWIHPFGDGNGRTARLVEFLIMGRSGLVAFPSAHLLSNHYNETRSRYYAELDRSSKTEDRPIKFFEYAVEGFVDGLREQVRYIRDQQIQVTWESHIHEQFRDKNSLSSDRQKHLLLDMPVEYTSKKNLLNVSPRVAREYASKSEKTLTRDLDSLKRMRLIIRSGTSYRPNREESWPSCRLAALDRELSGESGSGRINNLTAIRAETGMEPASKMPAAVSHPWDGYLIGPENELALAAAQALARGEREGISPLVVHGPSGVGKSRLLAGLVAERLRRLPGTAVAHLDAESFAEACVEAAGEPGVGGWSALRGRFRAVDLFVLEDLEGLERAPMAHDELAHTLDALEISGATVAVSTRAAPGTWPRLGWPTRFVNRLQGGLAARIDPPGLASRRRYVLQHASGQGLALQAEAVETIARGRRRLPDPRRLDRPARLGSSAQSPARGPERHSRLAVAPSWAGLARSADGRRGPGRGNRAGRTDRDDRGDRPSRCRPLPRPARRAARAQPPSHGRRGSPPGYVPGPVALRDQLRRDRNLLRRP